MNGIIVLVGVVFVAGLLWFGWEAGKTLGDFDNALAANETWEARLNAEREQHARSKAQTERERARADASRAEVAKSEGETAALRVRLAEAERAAAEREGEKYCEPGCLLRPLPPVPSPAARVGLK